jgi:hypothetical protein
VRAQRLTPLIVAIALACAGLGVWLGNTIADDTGSIVVVALACGVIGSFAPGTIRWAAAEFRRRDRR